ncbi:MAG: GGDEF domain-containing protein [Actinomycetota bacterium]
MQDLRYDRMVRLVLALWGAIPLMFVAWFFAPFPVVAWGVWSLFTLVHVAFAGDALRVARSEDMPAPTRRVWAGLFVTGALLVGSDLVRAAVMATTTPTPTNTDEGVIAQAVLVSVAIGVAVVAFLTHPLGLETGDAKLRFTLDLGVVMAATAAFSAYTLDWPDAPTLTEIAWAFLLGPGVSALAVATVFKLVLAPQRPFTTPAGLCLLAAALVNAVLGGMADSVLFTAYLPVGYSLSLVSSTMLPLGARLQLRSGRPVVARPDSVRRYALSPYVAAVAANVLMVFALAGQGLGPRSWMVVLATVTATGFVIVRQLTALSESSRLSAQLEHIAFHDTLTGLANRRSFDATLGTAMSQRSLRGPEPSAHDPITVMLVDLDAFKQVNDTLGHDAGDELLAAVADRLRACTRPGDMVARLGGDEFAVILEGSAEAVAVIASRIVEALAAPFPLAAGTAQIGGSVGVAEMGASGCSPDDVLRRADAAMYLAKRSGKGQVRRDLVAAE